MLASDVNVLRWPREDVWSKHPSVDLTDTSYPLMSSRSADQALQDRSRLASWGVCSDVSSGGAKGQRQCRGRTSDNALNMHERE